MAMVPLSKQAVMVMDMDEGCANSVPQARSPFADRKLGSLPAPRKPEVHAEVQQEMMPTHWVDADDPSESWLIHGGFLFFWDKEPPPTNST